jgi:hypothetical protein
MNQWLEERAREVRASIATIAELRAELSDLQLAWRPPDGGWSIAQVFEHLIISDASYLERMRAMVDHGKRGDTPWKPTFGGGLLIKTVSPANRRKTSAPRIYRPPAEPRARVVEAYLALRTNFLELIERADGVDLRRNRMVSPVTWLMRPNLGDAIMVLTVHTQRHLQQIDRIRARADFPSAFYFFGSE